MAGRPRKDKGTNGNGNETSEEKGKPGQKKLTEAECQTAFEEAVEALGVKNLMMSYDSNKDKYSVVRIKGNRVQTVIPPSASLSFARLCTGAKMFADIANEQD